VSYYAPNGHYSFNGNGFNAKSVDSPPLHAPASAAGAPNGVFLAGSDGFPNQTFGNTNYWVDAVITGSTPPPPPPPPPGPGYRSVRADGSFSAFGSAHAPANVGVPGSNAVSAAGPPGDANGGPVWLATPDGNVIPAGGATNYGSMAGKPLARPVVGIAATPDAKGYWLVASDGGIFTFGDAVFYGSTGAIRLNQPIVGISPTPSGHGYWLVAADGGIFTFGDALFYGSTGAMRLNKPVVGMESTPSGHGYWLVASDGGIFTFGDALFYGSTGAIRLNQPVTAMVRTVDGHGYWLVASDGGVFTFGDASFLGVTLSPVKTVALLLG